MLYTVDSETEQACWLTDGNVRQSSRALLVMPGVGFS
jgi:hypothetical protein